MHLMEDVVCDLSEVLLWEHCCVKSTYSNGGLFVNRFLYSPNDVHWQQ